jgi:hypothetical protein
MSYTEYYMCRELLRKNHHHLLLFHLPPEIHTERVSQREIRQTKGIGQQ